MDLSNLENSLLLYDLCNGLKIELEIYRRGVDQALFDFYFSLYKRINEDVKDVLPIACARFPYHNQFIDHALFLSDAKRCMWNKRVNGYLTKEKVGAVLVECEKDEDGKPKVVRNCTQQQTDMYLYVGERDSKQELIGCNRRGGGIVNGVIYTVKDVREKCEDYPDGLVTVKMNEEYSMISMLSDDLRRECEPYLEDVEKLVTEKERSMHYLSRKAPKELTKILNNRIGKSELVRWTMFVRLFKSLVLEGDTKVRLRSEDDENDDDDVLETVTMTHEEASAQLRMTYAFAYFSVQGATLKERHIALFDTRHVKSYFTMRHLIVGLSRATHSDYVHIPTVEQEAFMMK